MSSPVGLDHGEPHGTVLGWLFTYRADVPGVALSDNGTLFLLTGDEVQSDACLCRLPPHGNVRIVERREGRRTTRYLEGTPDFVFEVAASSAAYDLHSKKRAYERAGTPEYVVWQIYERRITWFRLVGGRSIEVHPDDDGVIESSVFPGLRLAVSKMIDGDYRGVLNELTDRRT